MNHESRHVMHNVTYQCAPWNDPNFWSGENVPSFVPRNKGGEEFHTQRMSVREFKSELGARSPRDAAYNSSQDAQLNCNPW